MMNADENRKDSEEQSNSRNMEQDSKMEESPSTSSSPNENEILSNAERTPSKKNEEPEFVKVAVEFEDNNTIWYPGGKKLLKSVVVEENSVSKGVATKSDVTNGDKLDRGLEKKKPSDDSECKTDDSSNHSFSIAVTTFHPNYQALLEDAIREIPSPSHPNTSNAKRRNRDDMFENLEKNDQKRTRKPAEKSDCGFEDLANLRKTGSSNSTEEPQETNRHTAALALLADRAHDLHSSSDNVSSKSNQNNKDELFEDLSESVQKPDNHKKKSSS